MNVNNANHAPKKDDLGIENGLRSLSGEDFSLMSSDVLFTLTRFSMITMLSVIIGVGFGLIASFISKNVPTLKIHPAREVFLILLVAYLGYVVSEMCHLSGIMTIFCCGMTMSYYTLYNMSSKSRKGSQLAVETIGHAAESFLFAYTGLSLLAITEGEISLSFTFLVLFSTFIARAIAIGVSYILLCKLTEKLDLNQLLIIWFSGLVKGAIAFGLSLQIPIGISRKRSYLVSTTLSVVLLSTIILGGLMSFFAKVVGLSKEKEMLKRMYASFSRDSGKQTMNRGMLSQYETGRSVIEYTENMTIKEKLIAIKLNIKEYIISFDKFVMRRYFGGATKEDEEQEREEEEIEEEETLRIFAEQHRYRFAAGQSEENVSNFVTNFLRIYLINS